MMSAIWQFIRKYEFWVLMLLAIGMYVVEAQLGIKGLGEVAFVFFLVGIMRLAMHPMWTKAEQASDE